VDVAVQLDVGTDLLIQRLAGRAQAEGRADDSPDAVRNRLRVYTDQTAPVIDFYRNGRKLICVYGVGGVEEVLERVLQTLHILGICGTFMGELWPFWPRTGAPGHRFGCQCLSADERSARRAIRIALHQGYRRRAHRSIARRDRW
jgi:hypothetical protein